MDIKVLYRGSTYFYTHTHTYHHKFRKLGETSVALLSRVVMLCVCFCVVMNGHAICVCVCSCVVESYGCVRVFLCCDEWSYYVCVFLCCRQWSRYGCVCVHLWNDYHVRLLPNEFDLCWIWICIGIFISLFLYIAPKLLRKVGKVLQMNRNKSHFGLMWLSGTLFLGNS